MTQSNPSCDIFLSLTRVSNLAPGPNKARWVFPLYLRREYSELKTHKTGGAIGAKPPWTSEPVKSIDFSGFSGPNRC